MRLEVLIGYLYGAAIVAVGVYGAIRGSIISLVASGVLGGLIAGSAFLTTRNVGWARWAEIGLVVLALLFFVRRYMGDRSAIHFGLLAVLGIVALLGLLANIGLFGIGSGSRR